MRVVGNRILVKPFKTAEVSKGGMVMAGELQTLPYGTIVQIGGNVLNVKIEELRRFNYAIGDVVLFTNITCVQLGEVKEDHVLIESEDILAVLEEGEY